MDDPRSIANFIVDARRFLGGTTTPLELQKLLFFCHASHLVGTGRPLVAGSFEAWENGPVHPTVYHSFKTFRSQPITRRALAVNLVTGEEVRLPKPDKTKQRLIVKTVVGLFELSAWQLVDLSHSINGPWDVVWRQRGSKGAVISDRTIAEHYSKHRLPIRATENENAEIDITDLPPYDD